MSSVSFFSIQKVISESFSNFLKVTQLVRSRWSLKLSLLAVGDGYQKPARNSLGGEVIRETMNESSLDFLA